MRVRVRPRAIVAMTSLAIMSTCMDGEYGDDQSRDGRHRQSQLKLAMVMGTTQRVSSKTENFNC